MDNIELDSKQYLFDIVFYENPQPMWFFDTISLRFIDVNQAAINHYGYSKEEFLELTIRDIRPKEDLEILNDTLNRLSGPATYKRRFRHLLKNGTIIYVQLVSYPVPYKNYQARLVMMTDLTESTLYIERFDFIAKATRDAIWDWNLQTNELWWNQTFLDLFEYQKEDIEHNIESWTNRIHPEDRDRVVKNIYNAIETGQANWSDEYRFLKGDGTYAQTLDRGYTIFKNGAAERMVGSMMDITQQRQLQIAREKSESLLKNITSASPAALWMSDETGNVIYVNQKWLEWSNAGVNENLGDGWLNAVHLQDRDRVRDTYTSAYNDKNPYEVDYRIIHKDDSVRWVTATGLPRYNDNDEFIGFVGSVTDITRQKHLELQKDDFISTVSHELKTPITSIKGYEQLLSRSNAITDLKGQNFLSRMRIQINRLDTLVQDLLDISRIESGKLSFKESLLEVNVMMAGLIPDLQLVYPTHTLMLVENQSCKILADSNRIIQLITNLVDNAVKYSPGADKVFIKLTCDEEYLNISIQDFGKGISKEQEAYIFERFYQVNNVYKAPGLGIGLYICKEIVKRLQGQIWFDSTPEAGSTFHFRLPRKLDD